MAFTKKEWQETRPSECKDSGVGEACGSWAKNCPADPEKFADDKVKTSNALKAIGEMNLALKTAEGKLSKSKDEKKVKATKALIADWKKEAIAYQDELNKAVFASVADELRVKREKAEEAVNQVLADNKFTVDETIGKMLDDTETALKKKDGDAAELKLTSAKRKLSDVKKYVKGGIPSTIKVELDRVKLGSDALKLSDFSTAVNALKSAIKKQSDRAEKLDKAWDDLVGDSGPTEPDTSKLDGEAKKNLETVLGLYKVTLKDLTACQTRAMNILVSCQKINGSPLIQTNPTGIVAVAGKAAEQITATEEQAKEVMFDIRESGGKCVSKRRALFKPDNAAPFTPFLTRAITVNGRMIGTLDKAVDELTEVLEAVVKGGNLAAVGPAQTLLGKL